MAVVSRAKAPEAKAQQRELAEGYTKRRAGWSRCSQWRTNELGVVRPCSHISNQHVTRGQRVPCTEPVQWDVKNCGCSLSARQLPSRSSRSLRGAGGKGCLVERCFGQVSPLFCVSFASELPFLLMSGSEWKDRPKRRRGGDRGGSGSSHEPAIGHHDNWMVGAETTHFLFSFDRLTPRYVGFCCCFVCAMLTAFCSYVGCHRAYFNILPSEVESASDSVKSRLENARIRNLDGFLRAPPALFDSTSNPFLALINSTDQLCEHLQTHGGVHRNLLSICFHTGMGGTSDGWFVPVISDSLLV
jgi:hypothetical protein